MARKKKDIEVVNETEVVVEATQDTTENDSLEIDTEVVLTDSETTENIVDEAVTEEQTEDEVKTEEDSEAEMPWYIAKALRGRDYYN